MDMMKKKAEETRRLFEKYQDRSLFIKADISKENDVINMYKKIEEKFNRLDGLVITLFMIKYLQ